MVVLVEIYDLGCACFKIVGDVTSMATIPSDMEVEAHFLAKEDGIVAGIALGEMIFREVDPSLKVSTLFVAFCLDGFAFCIGDLVTHFSLLHCQKKKKTRWIGF